MKKSAKQLWAAMAALLLAALSAACNLDANQGIFREISTSAKSSGIRIVEAAGYDAASKTAYFVADNGLMAQTEGGEPRMLVPSSASRQIKQATLYNDGAGHIRFLAQDTADGNKTSYHTYDLSDSDIEDNPLAAGKQVLLGAGMEVSLSGGAITVTDLGTGSSDATIATADSALQVLSFVDAAAPARELLLIWKDAGGKPHLDFFVVSGASLARYSLSTTQVEDDPDIAAFAYDSAGGRLLLAGRNGGLYYCKGSDWILKKSSQTLEDVFQSGTAAGFFSDVGGAGDLFVFKCDDSFQIAKWPAGEGQPSSVDGRTAGFASGLANENIVGAARTGSGEALVFTGSSGLFVLDVVADSNKKF